MKKRISWVALGLATVLLASACGQSKPAQQPATPAPSNSTSAVTPTPKPKEVKKIKVASAVTPPNVVHIPTYVALDQGFFKEEGLDAEVISLEGGVGTARAVISGAVDVAGTSADPIVAQFAASSGGDDNLIAIYTYAPRLDSAMIGGSSIKSPADLKGKKIGIQEVNAFAHIMSRLVLAKASIPDSDVTFVSGSTAGRLPLLLQGKTDTAILHIEQAYKAIQDNPQLNTVSNLWEADPNWWYSAYASTKGRIKQDPELFLRFTRAMVKTSRWMYKPENKDRVIEIYMKYNTGFSKDLASRSYDALVKGNVWPRNEGVSKEMVDYTVATQIKYGLLKTDKKITYEQVYDREFIDQVLKELGRDGNNL